MTNLTLERDLPPRLWLSPYVHHNFHQAGVSNSYHIGPPLKLSGERRDQVGMDF